MARPLRKKNFFIFLYVLAQKLLRIFFCQNPFPAILRKKRKEKKFLWPLSRGGGGLSGRATKKKNFFSASLCIDISIITCEEFGYKLYEYFHNNNIILTYCFILCTNARVSVVKCAILVELSLNFNWFNLS